MSRFTNTLGRVRVAAPCEEDWDEMRGDERVRFCSRCSLNVYNLSAMSRRGAEALVAGTEGRLCVRYYRRADGTILTRNCPVGLQAVKRRVAGVARAAASATLSFAAGVAAFVGFGLPHGYCGEELGEHSLPAPAQPYLPEIRPEARNLPADYLLPPETGLMISSPADEWVVGRMNVTPGEVTSRVIPLRRKARRN